MPLFVSDLCTQRFEWNIVGNRKTHLVIFMSKKALVVEEQIATDTMVDEEDGIIATLHSINDSLSTWIGKSSSSLCIFPAY